jgi:hypothetical protein
VDDELEVATVRVGTAAFNCRARVSDILPTLAVTVAVCAVPTDDTVAVNPALVAVAGTITVEGIVTAALLLEKLTLRPPEGAAALNVTVQASVPDPVMETLLQKSALNTGMPVPLKLMGGVPLIGGLLTLTELLTMVSCPVAVPAVLGLNCTLSVAV